jgi:hypothetical protein
VKGFYHEIDELLYKTERQLQSIHQIFSELKTTYSFTKCNGLIACLEDVFAVFEYAANDPSEAAFQMLSYFVSVQGMEQSFGYLLNMLAVKMDKISITNIVSEIVEQDKLLLTPTFLGTFAGVV